MAKVIMIDLDGVLNNYNGEYKEHEIDTIKQGAKEFLEELSKIYDIEIFTVRNKTLTEQWLKQNNIFHYIKNITDIKNPKATIFLDDRGLNFSGDFDKTLEQIKNFKPYWK